MEDPDVLVVGAGPVGLLAALGLAQAGASVMVVEAEGDVSDSPRAAVYFATSLIALQELGLLDDLDRLGVRTDSFGHHTPELNLHFAVSSRCMTGITYDYQLHCGQDVLCRVTMDHARRQGVEVRFGHRIVGLDQAADHVRATLETAEGRREVRAKWIVGADGARSTVRGLLGLEFEGFTWANRFVATNVHCDFRSLGYEPANFVCDPVNGAVIAVLDDKDLWRLTYLEDASTPRETLMERLPERYKAFIPEGVPYEVATANPYTLHQRCSTTLRKGRALLAGDAAHATNPCGGLGLTTGFWTAMILSDVLGAVIAGEAEESILDRYSEDRRRIFWDVVSPTAAHNKQALEEPDLEKRRANAEMMRAAASDPAIARAGLTFPFRVMGDVLRPGSRWANANPLAAAGIDVEANSRQLA
jgi:2-polyprenyl-6-methoxyphenol hydroxylase-like FAD-dependent oxidoreductase